MRRSHHGASAPSAMPSVDNTPVTIPHTFIQELIARADVVEIVGRYVQLKKGGANFMGLCPFHSEKSPSFSVSPTKQFYHCFGCGKSGDALRFLMDHAGMTFIEAVHDLAQQFGMQVPEDEASPEERARAVEKRQKQHTLTDVLEQACSAYKKHLRDSPRAIDYFKGRGLSGEIAKQFDLGYAPEGWRSLAGVFPHYDDPLLAESGLVITSEDDPDKRYDRFRDRVMFPIRNVKGECIGFGGRVLGDEKPKYLNSPETPVFSKGRELYGLFEARNALRDTGYALVTEGYMDVVALAQLGFPNAVATLGTACTADHLQKLFRFTDAVVFSFDGDAAGRRAARKALDGALSMATDVRSCKFLFLPPEHDPDSFVRTHGRDAFARCIAEATPLSRFLIESAREGCELHTAEGRALLASNAKPLWGQLPEGALKRQLLGEIADLVQLSNSELTDVWQGKAIGSRPEKKRYDKDSTYSKSGKRWEPKPPPIGSDPSGRRQPASRADHATRLLLGNSSNWDSLPHEDQALLCELPAPHGNLFAWLEHQQHEHGPQTWGHLREAMRDQPFEALALKLMSGPDAGLPTDPQATPGQEAQEELRALLNLLQIDQLMLQETQALADSDLERYRALNARRRALMAAKDA